MPRIKARKIRVLIACECSGRVRDAFIARGHDAWSCDVYPSEVGGPHIQKYVEDGVLEMGWDLMIAHPPCTHLTTAGSRFFKRVEKRLAQLEALAFFRLLLDCEAIPKRCIENPVGIASTRICKPDQIIQPYEYGDPERKTTCLWLRGLPALRPTIIVEPSVVASGGSAGRDGR